MTELLEREQAPGLALGTPGPLDRLVTLPEGIPKLTLGWEAIKWASSWLKHPNGPRAGQRWQFVESQVRWYLWWYALGEDGRWLYTHGVRRLAKGSGKSPNAGVHCWIEFCAPVRLKYFDPDAPGGCTGKRVDMPLVEIAATAESQTANTMRMVRALATKKSRMVKAYEIDVGKTVMYDSGGGELRVITSSAAAEEGALTTFAVLDETEHWTPITGGKDLAAVMDRNLSKSNSRAVETCNAWEPGLDTVAENTYDAWILQEEGHTVSEDRILYDARIAPPEVELADTEDLEKAIAFVYDDCFWIDQRTIKNRLLDVRTDPEVGRRFYLNQPRSSNTAWVQPQEWSALSDPEFTIDDGDDIAIFFDGSRTRDATAIVGCHIETGYVFTIDVWEPQRGSQANGQAGEYIPVPVLEIDAAMERAWDRWNVVTMFCDVREWESFVRVEWPKRWADKITQSHWAVPSGKEPQPFAWDMRTHVYDFTMATELAFTEITEDRAFKHDGDSRLARHVINARRYPNRWGVSISKETPDSSKKIDAAVCMIGARQARRLYLAGEQQSAAKKKTRSGRVYSFA